MAKRKAARKSPSGPELGKKPISDDERRKTIEQIEKLQDLLGSTPTWDYKKHKITEQIKQLQDLYDAVGKVIQTLQDQINTDPGGGPNPKD